MNVYVETNFVLEHALEQEQCESCEELIEIASAGSISLVIPAFSLPESHVALMHKQNARSRLTDELRGHLTELKRSRAYRAASSDFTEMLALLIRSVEKERDALNRTVDKILRVARVIPLNSDILYAAGAMELGLALSFQDSIVLASVIQDIQAAKHAKSCFLNRNTKDFDDPNVRDMLREIGCRFFGSFDDAVSYIQARIRNGAE